MDQLKLNEFFIEGENQEISHVLLHVIQPSTPEEEKEKGYFFAVCEIDNGAREDVTNLQRLIDDVENSYYETTADGKNPLETVLEKANQENLALFEPDISLNCLVGAVRGGEIFFSHRGRPQVLLFYRDKEGAYRRMDLTAEGESDGQKLFPQIVQGKISPNDYFFAATSRVADYFNHDRLQKIITTRPPEQSAEHLEKVLSEIKNGLSFGGLIINLTRQEAPAAAIGRPPSDERPNPLFATEQQTARTLSPSFWSKVGNKIGAMMAAKRENVRQKERRRPVEESYAPAEVKGAHLRRHEAAGARAAERLKTAFMIARRLAYWFWLLVVFFGRLLLKIGKNLILVFIAAFNIQKRRQEIFDNWREAWRAARQKFTRLPLGTKILGLSAAALAVIFCGSIIYLQINKSRAETERVYQENIQIIRNGILAAESKLLYNDLNGALGEIQNIKNTTAVFVCRTADQNICRENNDKIGAVLAKARKMQTVKPKILVDWNVLGQGTPAGFFKIGNKLVAFATGSPRLYVYDLLTKENKTVPIDGTAGFANAAVPKENDYAVLIRNNKELWLFDPKNNSLKRAEAAFPPAGVDISAAVVYNRRLYALDALSNQIFRNDATANGFGAAKDWLKTADANLRGGISLAVDGDLFVLKNDGQILKYTKGERADFNISGLDPSLAGGKKIYTYTDWKYLYVLDGQEKRLVLLDKNGQLFKQLTADEFDAPSDLAVDETAGLAYVLDKGKVMEIGLK